MTNRPKQNRKDVRVVVRVPRTDADWLGKTAERAQASVSYIIRLGIRRLKEDEASGQLSFDFADDQHVSLAA